MVMVIDPLDRKKFIRVNGRYDNQDVVVENVLPERRIFKDREKTDQLTQNSWNLSPYTREDRAVDIVIHNPKTLGRLERTKHDIQPGRYHERREI